MLFSRSILFVIAQVLIALVLGLAGTTQPGLKLPVGGFSSPSSPTLAQSFY